VTWAYQFESETKQQAATRIFANVKVKKPRSDVENIVAFFFLSRSAGGIAGGVRYDERNY
jgi:hypothetical protein